MNRKTLQALKASIAKWENKVKAASASSIIVGVQGCPLCALFWKFEDFSCAGCPVYAHSGLRRCDGTPFEAAFESYERWASDEECGKNCSHSREEFRAAARHEVDFLKSLLPTAAKAITAPTEEKAL